MPTSTDVIQVFTGQAGFQAAPPWAVAQNIGDEIGVATLVALVGLFAVIFVAWHGSTSGSATVVATLSDYFRPKRKSRLILVGAAALILFASYLSLPLYQIVTSNIRSVWKAAYASLIFLAPLAGYTMARVIERIQRLKRTRLVAAALVTLLVVELDRLRPRSQLGISESLAQRQWGHRLPSAARAFQRQPRSGRSRRGLRILFLF